MEIDTGMHAYVHTGFNVSLRLESWNSWVGLAVEVGGGVTGVRAHGRTFGSGLSIIAQCSTSQAVCCKVSRHRRNCIAAGGGVCGDCSHHGQLFPAT